ncbi:MAG: hypothetical protein C5B50_12255 [Verrucomicrobia bacterium]|nr:MAG: hypothetical protein C5B50_12255 [Verrucomicrobiota bacterium]
MGKYSDDLRDACPKCGALSYKGGYCFRCGTYRSSSVDAFLEEPELPEFLASGVAERLQALPGTEEDLDEAIRRGEMRYMHARENLLNRAKIRPYSELARGRTINGKSKFVVTNDQTHKILRRLTSTVPLIARKCDSLIYEVTYSPVDLLDKLPDLYFFIAGETPPLLLDKTAEINFVRRMRFFDATMLDARCRGTSRLTIKNFGPRPDLGPGQFQFNREPTHEPSLFSAELLCFGAGALRRLWDNPTDPDHYRARKYGGRLNSRRMMVYETISGTYYTMRYRKSLPENWESTNVVYGDAYGELEQIWSRRGEKRFLRRIMMALNRVRKMPNAETFHTLYPRTPMSVSKRHLEIQSIWDTPIRSCEELLRRVSFIIENTSLDDDPSTFQQDIPPIKTDDHDYFQEKGLPMWLFCWPNFW